MKESAPKQATVIYWDDHHIDLEMELFPEPLRELYQWFKTYVRDSCGRDIKVVTQQAKGLGVTIDETNWSRILKGRWMHDAQGHKLPNPYVSAQNLLNAMQAVREKCRVELIEGTMPFTETIIFHTIRRFIEKKMRRDRVNRFGVIIGPTGLQKTASYEEIARRTPGLKWIEAADNGSNTDFVRRLAIKCGAGKHSSQIDARRAIFRCMMPVNGQPKGVIVDNMQDMAQRASTKSGEAPTKQPAFQFMRMLQDETKCCVIWSITPEDEDTMFDARSIYLEQFEGRAGGRSGFLRLPNYSPPEDLVKIAAANGLRDAAKHVDLLVQIGNGRGRIRRFFEVLQEAKDLAADAGEPLSAEHLKEAKNEMAGGSK